MKAGRRNRWSRSARIFLPSWGGLRFLLPFCLLPAAFCFVSAPPSPPDIRDIVAPQPYFVQGSFWFLVVAVLCLCAAVVVGGWLFVSFRRPKRVELPSAHAVARRRLAELSARLDETDARTFGAEAADILRGFIGAQYGLRVERQTSPEFLASIRGAPVFSTIQHDILEGFLTRCDLLKFAREDATHLAKQRLIEQAAQFLTSEPPALPPGTPGVLPPGVRLSPAPPMVVPPPLPLAPFEPPDARYMPPDPRQTVAATTES